jgi:hypothetical protein
MKLSYLDLIAKWVINTPGVIARCGNNLKAFDGVKIDDKGFGVRIPDCYSICGPKRGLRHG